MRRQNIFFVLITASIVLIDQFFKSVVEKSIPLHQEIARLGTLFSVTYSQNQGASFGILQGKTPFLIWFSIAVLIGIVWYLRKMPTKMAPFAALIAGGAVSNLIDRVNLGYVVDYVNFLYIPTFNLADVAITVGTVGVGWLLYFKKS